MALKIDLRPGQAVQVGDVTFKLVKKSGQIACIVIEADKSVAIRRLEDSEQSQPPQTLALQA